MGDSGDGAISYDPVVLPYAALYFVDHRAAHGRILVFSERGEYLRSLGRPGQGPGELYGVSDIDVGPDGNLWITDNGNRRMTVMTAEGDFVFGFRLPGGPTRYSTEVLADSSLIFNALVPTADRIGLWTHRWHPSRGFLWSIRDDDTETRGTVHRRAYAIEGDTLWVARNDYRYRIEAYRLSDGTFIRALNPVRPWFEDFKTDPVLERDPEEQGIITSPRPRAMLTDIRVVDGLLWVIGFTADEEWHRAHEEGFRNLGRLNDGVIDVFDPTSGDLLVTQHFDLPNTFLSHFMDDRTIVGHQTNPVVDKAVLFRAQLVGPVSPSNRGMGR